MEMLACQAKQCISPVSSQDDLAQLCICACDAVVGVRDHGVHHG